MHIKKLSKIVATAMVSVIALMPMSAAFASGGGGTAGAGRVAASEFICYARLQVVMLNRYLT